MLEHLRIIELGQVIAGTFGGMILADLGADVIKVEPLTGDPGRGAAVYGIDGESAIHLTVNRSKRSIAINLKDPRGRDVLLDLVASADAVIENFRPGVLERLGIGHGDLVRVKPDIVLVSVSGFGTDSPYRDLPAYDLIMQAMSGHMRIMGESGRPPVIMGIPLADIAAGVYSVIAVLAALQGDPANRRPTHVDLAMLDVMLALLSHVATLHVNTGREQEPQGSAHPFITPWQAFRCADGEYVVVAPREQHFWEMLCSCLGLEELTRTEFASALSRHAHRDQLLPLLEDAFTRRTSGEWLTALRAAGVPAAPVNDLGQAFQDPHVAQRRMVRSYELDGRPVRVVGNPLRFVGHAEPEPRPAPAVGAHTDELLGKELGYSDEVIARLHREGVVT
jgi:CoA:oxalate CoA-transferase